MSVAELFSDTLITTNYDRLIEQVFDDGSNKPVQVLTPATILTKPDADRVTILKLHGTSPHAAAAIARRQLFSTVKLP